MNQGKAGIQPARVVPDIVPQLATFTSFPSFHREDTGSMTLCRTCNKEMSVETYGEADEYWSEYCLNIECKDPDVNHGGPDIDEENRRREEYDPSFNQGN